MNMNVTTIPAINADTTTQNEQDLYFTTDTAEKKFWKIDPYDTTSVDDGVNVLTNLATPIQRFKPYVQDYVNAKWFGALGDGETDDTVPIQAAVDFMVDYHLGELMFPAGTYIITDTINIRISNFVSEGAITIRGVGKKSTVFQGLTSNLTFLEPYTYFGPGEPVGYFVPGLFPTLTPETWLIFHVDASSGLNSYVSFEHLSIRASNFIRQGWYSVNEEHPKVNYYWLDEQFYELTGIKLELTAIFYLEDVEVIECETCVHGVGALVFNLNNFVLGGAYGGSSSATGLFTEVGTYTDIHGTHYIYSNAITLTNGRITYCTQRGINFGQGALLTMRSLDLEQNGSLMEDGDLLVGDPNTGAIFIRNDVNDESGNPCQVNTYDCWFESNYGYTYFAEAEQNNILNFYGCKFSSGYIAAESLGVNLYLAGGSPPSGVKKINIIGCFSQLPGSPYSFITNAYETVVMGCALGAWQDNTATNIIPTPSTIDLARTIIG